MKIILAAKSIYPFHPAGGVQKYVYYFSRALKRLGVDVEIIAPCDAGKPRKKEIEGVTYHLINPAIYTYLEYPIGWFGVHLFSWQLAKYLKTLSFDILHSFDMVAYQYLKIPQRKPVISQIFTDNYLSNPISLNVLSFSAHKTEQIKKKKVAISPFADRSTILKFPFQYYFKTKPMHDVLKFSDVVLFEEESFREEVEQIYRLNKSQSDVLPVGTDISFIDGAMKKKGITRASIGLKQGDLVLITVNRLAADKGVDKIVLALPKLTGSFPNIKLIIVGSGYQEKEILSLIAHKGLNDRVLHFKNVKEEDLYLYYALSDIYISAFSYPGSSVSTLEAMACSLPIVTTGQPWLVKNNLNGIFIPSNDPQEITEAILKITATKNLKEQGRMSRTIVEEYDWTKIAGTAVLKYKKLLKHGSS